MAEAEQEIVKMKADAAAQAAQDQVTPHGAFRRPPCRAGRVRQRIRRRNRSEEEPAVAGRGSGGSQLDVKSRAATSHASLAVVQRSATKPCSRCSVRSRRSRAWLSRPLDGVVSVKQNTDAAGGMFFSGMVLPEYREGDSIWPGRPIADVIESGAHGASCEVDENDRANLTQGQEAVIDIDTIPGETFKGKVGELSAAGAPHGFLRIELRRSAVRRVVRFRSTRPADEGGASARVMVTGKEIAGALMLPRQAVFQKTARRTSS